MKLRIIAILVLVMILSAGISNKASAYGGRGCHRGGWHGSHRVVRVCAPRVVVRGCHARPYAQPVYYAHAHRSHRHVYRHHGCYR